MKRNLEEDLSSARGAGSFEGLLARLVKRLRSTLLVSLGDLGRGLDWRLFFTEPVLSRVLSCAIYGNHDNVAWLER